MLTDITTLATYAALLIAIGGVITVYLKVKSVSNDVLRIATADFDRTVTSLLSNPSDLPVEALHVVKLMIRSADAKGAPYRLRRVVRMDRKGKINSSSSGGAYDAIRGLRPELQELMVNAFNAWITIVKARNVFHGLLLHYEFMRLRVTRGRLGAIETRETYTVVSNASHAA